MNKPIDATRRRLVSYSDLNDILTSSKLKFQVYDGNGKMYLNLLVDSPRVSIRELEKIGRDAKSAYDADQCIAGCVLTTACCDMIGLEDDCWELRTLRKFRDDWLRSQSFGDEEISQYYKVEIIAKFPDGNVKISNFESLDEKMTDNNQALA
jgi:hypothetical protein